MATIITNEQDATKSVSYSPTDTIVFIPGLSGQGKDAGNLVNKPVLYTSDAAFVEALGTKPRKISGTTDFEYDKSFVMARQLLTRGMSVIYSVIGTVDSEGKPGGTMATTKEEIVATLSSYSFWETLEDRALYNPRFITSGGYSAVQESSSAIATCMVQLASFQANGETLVGRGDCVALIDHPKSIVDASVVKDLFQGAWAQGLSGEYASAMTPWCSFDLTVEFGLTDAEKEHNLDMINGFWALPASFAYTLGFNEMIKANPNWFAAAGVTRGTIPMLKEPLAKFGDRACRALQSRMNGFIAVNPICDVAPYGYRIYGNRTMRQNGIDGLKATSFLNVRNLISDIKKVAFQACREMTYEQNTDVLWANWKNKIIPTLETMRTGQGIDGYAIKKLATAEKGKVVGQIIIVPVESVEDFSINIVLSDTLEITTTE